MKLKTEPTHADLRLWWIPQIPMEQFHYPVPTVEVAIYLWDCLAKYDLFQYEKKVKPDYSNAGGLEVFEDNEWTDWFDEETGEDFDEYRERYLEEHP